MSEDFSGVGIADPPTDHPKPNHHASDDSAPVADFFRPSRERGRNRQKTESKPSKPIPEYRSGMFVEPIREIYGGAAFLLMPFKPDVAQIVAKQADDCARAWDYAAKESPV